jgi:hypothetical protein
MRAIVALSSSCKHRRRGRTKVGYNEVFTRAGALPRST